MPPLYLDAILLSKCAIKCTLPHDPTRNVCPIRPLASGRGHVNKIGTEADMHDAIRSPRREMKCKSVM